MPSEIGRFIDISTRNTIMATKQTSEESAIEKLNEARKRNLDLAISHIQKEFGESAIMRLGDDRCVDVDVIPTGNLLIDRALGVGGFPCGRIVEVFGPESSGKTTLTLTVIAQAQKRGGLAAFIDVEHALDPQYARILEVLSLSTDSRESEKLITTAKLRMTFEHHV